MKIAIGVISYLPDGKDRNIRITKLNNLLKQCDNLFGLPIFIIGQNGDSVELDCLSNSTITLYKYKDKLGITGARRELRNRFLNSEYDYLIMLDDDIYIQGSKAGIEKYLEQINDHPDMYGIFKQLTLQLFAISKYMFNKIDGPDGEPINGDFFEDMGLILALKKLYPTNKFVFQRHGVDAVGNASNDNNSTWYHGQIDKHSMGDKTREMIENLKGE